eukprot:958029-Rhodomonas_salina.2
MFSAVVVGIPTRVREYLCWPLVFAGILFLSIARLSVQDRLGLFSPIRKNPVLSFRFGDCGVGIPRGKTARKSKRVFRDRGASLPCPYAEFGVT